MKGQSLFSEKNKKKISIGCLQKTAQRVLMVDVGDRVVHPFAERFRLLAMPSFTFGRKVLVSFEANSGIDSFQLYKFLSFLSPLEVILGHRIAGFPHILRPWC